MRGDHRLGCHLLRPWLQMVHLEWQHQPEFTSCRSNPRSGDKGVTQVDKPRQPQWGRRQHHSLTEAWHHDARATEAPALSPVATTYIANTSGKQNGFQGSFRPLFLPISPLHERGTSSQHGYTLWEEPCTNRKQLQRAVNNSSRVSSSWGFIQHGSIDIDFLMDMWFVYLYSGVRCQL